jgi:hypothetical protein
MNRIKRNTITRNLAEIERVATDSNRGERDINAQLGNA